MIASGYFTSPSQERFLSLVFFNNIFFLDRVYLSFPSIVCVCTTLHSAFTKPTLEINHPINRKANKLDCLIYRIKG